MNVDAEARLVGEHWDEEASAFSPEQQHKYRYLEAVCVASGHPPTPYNCAQVEAILHKNGIEPYHGDEYPKGLYEMDAQGNHVESRYPVGHAMNGLPVVFHSREEEDAWHHRDDRHDNDHEHHDDDDDDDNDYGYGLKEQGWGDGQREQGK